MVQKGSELFSKLRLRFSANLAVENQSFSRKPETGIKRGCLDNLVAGISAPFVDQLTIGVGKFTHQELGKADTD